MAKKSSSVDGTVKTDKTKPGIAKRTKVNLDTSKNATGPKVDAKTTKTDLKRQLRIQKALYEIADAASVLKDMQAFYKKLHKIVAKLMYAGNFFIALYDEQTDLITWPYYADEKDTDDSLWAPERLKDSKTATAWGIRTGKSVHMRIDLESLLKSREMELGSLNTLPVDGIGIPLKSGRKVLGVLAVQSYTSGIIYNEQDVQVLTFVAQHISTALTRARALEAERQRTDELAILNSVGEAMAKTLDVKTVTKIVGDKVQSIFDSEVVNIRLYDAATNTIQRAYDYDQGYEDRTDTSFPMGKGLTSEIIETGKPLVYGTKQEMDRVGALTTPKLISSPVEETQSYMGVPIITGDKVIGVVSVQSYKQHAYNENHVRLLETLASNMGVAIQNARLFEAEQERVAELAVINSVQEGLASKLDIQGIYDLVGDKLYEIFKTDILYIALYHPEKNSISYPYGIVRGEKNITLPELELGGFSGEAIRKRQTVVLNEDIERRSAEVNSYTMAGDGDPQSMVYVPIIAGENVLGVVSLQSYDHGHIFPESDIRLLETLTNSMSVALQNAQSFKAEQERVSELQIINSIQQGLAAELDFQAIIDLVGDKLKAILHTSNLSITWYDQKTNLVHYLYAYEHGQRLNVLPMPPTPGGQFETMRQTPQPIVANNAADFERLNIPVVPGTDSSKSLATVPIISSDRVLGGIQIENHERENAFGESELRLLTTIAASLGTALENARLFDETQRLLKETEQRAQELAIINSVQQGLASKLDMQAIFALVGDQIQSMFNAQAVIISSFDHEKEVSRLEYGFENGQRIYDDELLPLFSLMNRHLIETRKPVVINEKSVEESKRYGLKTVEGTQVPRSLIYVPFGTGKHVNGYFSLQNMERENAFTESDVRLLQTLAGSMGIALENARLNEEIQNELTRQIQAKEKEEHRRLILEKVITTGQSVTEVHDVRTTLMYIWHGVHDDLGFDRVGLYLYNPERNSMDGTFGTNNQGEMVDEWHTWVSLNEEAEGGKSFLRVIEKPDTILLTRAYESDNEVPEGHIMSGVQDFAAIAAWAGAKPVAAICVDHKITGRRITDEQLEALRLFAGYAGLALENARLFDETQRLLKETEQRNAELAIINSVQAALAAELNIQGIYEAVGNKIREIFRDTDLNIRIYDPKSNLVHFPYFYEGGRRIEVDSVTLIEHGVTPHILRSRKTLVINENLEEETNKLGSYTLPGTEIEKSAVFVPLIIGDQARGLINLSNMEREHAFSDLDVRLLETLANSMSVALENARLFDETQRLLKETEQRNAELAIINSVQEGLVAKMDIQAIYDLVGDKIRDIFDVQVLLISIFDHAQGLSHVPYTFEKGERIFIDSGPLTGLEHYIVQTRQVFLCNERFVEKAQELFGGINIPAGEIPKSILVMPLTVSDQVKGIISLQNVDRENAFSDSDVRLLTTLANSMSVALENARLFDEISRHARESAALNEVGRDISSTLNLSSVMERIASHARVLLAAETSAIFLPEGNGATFRAIVTQGLNAKEIKADTIQAGEGIIGTLAQQGKAEFINDTNKDPRGIQIPGTPEQEEERLMVAPLLTGDKVGGMMAVWRQGGEAFIPADLEFLQGLSLQAAIAIKNANFFDEIEQRAAELAIINSVQKGLASRLEMQAIYELVGEKIREVFDAQVVVINSFDTEKQLTIMRYGVEKGKRFYNEPYTLTEGHYRLIKKRQPLLINEDWGERMSEYGFTINIVPGTEAPKSTIIVPLIVNNEVKGSVSLQNVDRENAFSEADARLLTTLTNSMSVALENARLFDETQRLLKETELRAAELTTINTVSNALAGELDLSALIDLVGEQIRNAFSADIAYVALLDEETNNINFPYEYGQHLEPLPLGQGLTSKIIEKREPLLINQDVNKRREQLGATQVGVQARSYLGVPIFVRGKVIGVVSVQSTTQEDLFTEDDQRLLSTIAANVGVALQNARLFDEIQTRNNEITESLEQQTATSEILRVIASSPTDIQPVLDAVAKNAARLCEANDVQVYKVDGDLLRQVTHFGPLPALQDGEALPLARGLVTGRAVLERRTIHIEDMKQLNESEYPDSLALQKRLGHRTSLTAPLLREGNAIGAIVIRRNEVRPIF